MTARGKERLDGVAFLFGCGALLAMVPRANRLFALLATDVAARVVILSLLAVVGLATVVLALRRSELSRPGAGSIAVLGALAAIAVAAVCGLDPAIRVHLVGFAVLSVLAYRWLRHRLRDRGVHLAAAALVAVVGIVDETWQWWIPGRYWDLGDIGVDAAAGLWAQLAIGWGIRPATTDRPAGRRSLRIGLRSLAVTAGLLFLSLVNTPPRIEAYASRIPALGHLGGDRSTRMIEYGHRFVDPEIGVFRSRLSAAELRRVDRGEAAAAGARLAAYAALPYDVFQRTVSPAADPFAFEAMVHLFYRERLWQRALEEADPAARRALATAAYREARILERWFGATLARSGHALAADRRRQMAALHDPAAPFESEVSDWLVTAFTERQASWTLPLLVAALLLAAARLRPERGPEAQSPPSPSSSQSQK